MPTRRQWGWFALLWFGGVLAVGAAAALIRLFL